jgi:molybdopterin converting factor subunit 1
MNQIKVLFFANLKDYTGVKSLEMEIPAGLKVKELTEQLLNTYPRLEIVRGSMVTAINRKYAGEDEVIPEKAEIAIFPPVSGG